MPLQQVYEATGSDVSHFMDAAHSGRTHTVNRPGANAEAERIIWKTNG